MNLLNYIKSNNLNEMETILSKTNISQHKLSNALFSACYRNNIKAVEMLIKAGANVNYECNLGTPLTEALEEENFEIARILIKAGADTSSPQYGEVSLPLMIAAEKGNLEMVKLLIKVRADVNQIHQSTGSFALSSAAAGGHEHVFQYLASLTNPELRKEAEAILPLGIHKRELEENVDPLVRELSDLVFDKNLEGVKEIIKKGVDVDRFDENGNTALCLAGFGGDLEIVRVLLEAGADPNLIPDDETTPPIWSSGSGEIAKLLINAGADINFQDSNGKTDLMITAGGWGRLEKFKVLLEARANTQIIDNQGKTALMYAVKDSYNLEKVRLLIKAGTNVNVKDNNGNTALSLAKEAGDNKIIQLLLEAGAKEEEL